MDKPLEYWEKVLDDLDVPIEETTTKERLADYMAENFNLPKGADYPSEAQVSRLWEAATERYESFAPEGIHSVPIHYKTGPRAGQQEVRYAVAGEPGLWSYAAAQEWAEYNKLWI